MRRWLAASLFSCLALIPSAPPAQVDEAAELAAARAVFEQNLEA